MTENLTEESLAKLKVPELRTLCKARTVTHSNRNKAQLIAALLGQPIPGKVVKKRAVKEATHVPIAKKKVTTAPKVTTAEAGPIPPVAPPEPNATVFQSNTPVTTECLSKPRVPANRPKKPPAPKATLPNKTATPAFSLTRKHPLPTQNSMPHAQVEVQVPKKGTARPLQQAQLVPHKVTPFKALQVTRRPFQAPQHDQYADYSSDWISSFLTKAYKATPLPLPTFPDCNTSALRFVIFRAMSMLFGFNEGVVDPNQFASSVVSAIDLPNGITKLITLNKNGDREKCYAISQTGEMISEQRPDWKVFVNNLTFKEKLSELVRTQDENYPMGIAKSFRGEEEARALAETYILTHVAPKAVSGMYQSVLSQLNEFTTITDGTFHATRVQKVALYLPTSHLVESVKIANLHPALAIVQTPHRAHYILRLTGQIVGDEEEGVTSEMQLLLDCTSVGMSKQL